MISYQKTEGWQTRDAYDTILLEDVATQRTSVHTAAVQAQCVQLSSMSVLNQSPESIVSEHEKLRIRRVTCVPSWIRWVVAWWPHPDREKFCTGGSGKS